MNKNNRTGTKRIMALVFACALLLGNMNVLAAENDTEVQATETQETETQKTEMQEKSGTLTLDSVGYKCRDEVGKKGDSWGAKLINIGTEDIDLSQYDLKARGLDAANGVEFELEPLYDPVLKGLDENGEGGVVFLSFSYTIPADCKEPVVKFVVDIFAKGDTTTPLYTTKENELYPYVISDGVLNHNDTSFPPEYELKVETDTGINFSPWGGPIYSDGEWTEIIEESSVRWFLKSGYPQAFQVGIEDESYAPAVAELIPPEAGTVRRVQGQPGIFAVDLHAPATLKVSSAKLNTKNWMNTVEQYVANMQWIDLKKQSTQESHFFEETALADDVAVVTYCRGNYDAYADEAGNVVIPYAVFAKDAEKFFQNIPDLKAVKVENLISYDASKDAFVGTDAQFAEAPYTTVVEKVDEYGNNTYAIRFKLSKKTLTEGVSDMNDPQRYTECTLVVEDNGQGQWRYLTYVEGWDFTPNITEEPVEPQKPAEPEQDASLVNPNKDEEHASDYLVVIDETSSTSNKNEAPKTGDSVSVTFSVSLLTFAVAALAVLLRKRVYNRI